MSNTTKRVLAMSLKGLLNRRPLDGITIQDLVDDAEVSRKTFYYHFQDIYDLLEWTFIEEGKRVLSGSDGGSWQQALQSVFGYFQENRTMILNVYRSLQKNSTLLKEHVSWLVRPLLRQLFDAQPDHELVDSEDRDFILELYAYGLIELFQRWIDGGMEPDGAHLMGKLDRIFDGSMERLIQRCLDKGDPEGT